MKINIIREFLHLCRTKNFTRTAEELYISQSVLSRHISSLEEELGSQLINRSHTSFALTDAGEAARESFTKILEEYQDLLNKVAKLSEDASGELDVGVLYYDYSAYIEPIRETFHQHFPGITLRLHSYQPEQIEKDILAGRLDAAFLYSVKHLNRTDLKGYSFLQIPYTVMFDQGHRLAKIRNLKVTDLAGEKILWPSSRLELNNTSSALSKILTLNETELSEYLPFDNFDDVPFLLKDTGAIYISPMANVLAYPSSVEKRELEPERYHTDISLLWRKDRENSALFSLLQAVRITYP